MTLRPGQTVPFFEVSDTAGARVAYRDIWQRRPLVLIRLPGDGPEWRAYAAATASRAPDLSAHGAALVLTTDPVPGLPSAGAVVADRWGEIHEVTTAATPAEMPGADVLVEWLRFVQHQCPECQGEAR